MKLRVLGCSGGIGGNQRTTSMLIDDDILLDAGTGVGDLSFDELLKIEHVFVTHSHLDHIGFIPFLVDTVGIFRDRPITVYSTPETEQILREHIFNWKIWPDFSAIPSPEKASMRYRTMQLGETIELAGRRFTSIPANHTVPAVGYWLDSGRASLIFTGDTTASDELWEAVNRIENLRYLIIETAFCNHEKEIAVAAKHLYPSLLARELEKLKRPAEILISHLKPGEIELTMKEINHDAARFKPRMLFNGLTIDF